MNLLQSALGNHAKMEMPRCAYRPFVLDAALLIGLNVMRNDPPEDLPVIGIARQQLISVGNDNHACLGIRARIPIEISETIIEGVPILAIIVWKMQRLGPRAMKAFLRSTVLPSNTHKKQSWLNGAKGSLKPQQFMLLAGTYNHGA